jgi:hypothetical protein
MHENFDLKVNRYQLADHHLAQIGMNCTVLLIAKIQIDDCLNSILPGVPY